MKENLQEYACPKCGNTTEQEGIVLAWRDWALCPVKGQANGKIYVEASVRIGRDYSYIGMSDETAAYEVDKTHLRCNKCAFAWNDRNDKLRDADELRKRSTSELADFVEKLMKG